MEELLRILRRFGSVDLASEDAACAALVRARWPKGIPPCHCGAARERHLAHFTCAGKRAHRATVLLGTPFASKTKPRVRALFLAIRAFALTPRGLSAEELAREVGAPKSTIWRHLHTLRALLPEPVAIPSTTASANRICNTPKAYARVGATVAMCATLRPPEEQGRVERLVGESVRTKINGTHHGVSARWLCRYLDEATARWRLFDLVLEELAAPLVEGGPTLRFKDVEPPWRWAQR